MRPFIQATEIWTPSRDRSILEFHDGLYGPHHAFSSASQKMCFGYGEGLPGRAWAARHPIIIKDLQHPGFMRRDAATRAGLTCGVAIPIFAGDFLLSVLVFFCGDDDDHVGAIELWYNDPARSADLGLVDGYFGIAESFQWVAQHTRFTKGFGLPGLVWESGLPEIMEDLGHSNRFVRSDDARRVGINKGLGLPSLYDAGQNHVITFLSALGTPIARRFDTWIPDQDGKRLLFRSGECDREPDFAQQFAGLSIERGAGVLGKVLQTGLPAVSEAIYNERSLIGDAAREAGLASMVAIPVLENGRIKSVVGMYF